VVSVPCGVLVGREAEWSRLRGMWDDARSGAGSVVVLRGIAGVGKSRLARELVALARASGCTVLTGRTNPAGDTPLRPLREGLLGLARSGYRPAGDALAPFLAPLGRLVPDWADTDPAELSPLVIGEGIVRVLADVARHGNGALLVVDDVQWADPDTAAVLEYLADQVGSLPAMVLLTARDGEHGPGADVVARLEATRAALTIRLGTLDAAGVAQMVRACLGGDEVDPALATVIARRSDGVPFFVEELLAAAAPASAEPAGVERTVPDVVRSSVASRMATLPADGRALLTAAALLGRHFDWQVAAEAVGVERAAGPRLLRLAVRAQLVEVDGTGFRFRHELTRDAVLAELVPGERAALARSLLSALGDPGEIGERVEMAASLAEDAGDVVSAARLLRRAARDALSGGSLASAESLAQRAKALSTGDDAADAALLLLEIRAAAGHAAVVLRDGTQMLDGGDGRPRLLAVMARAALDSGRYRDVDELVARVQASAPDAPDSALPALAAQAAMGRGDVETAAATARRALDAAGDTGAAEAQCEALEVLGRAARVRDVAAAEAAFARAHATAVAAGLPVWRIRALQELGTIDMYESLATQRLLRARDDARAAGGLSLLAVVELQLAATYNERGEVEPALAAAQRSEEISRRFRLGTLAMATMQRAFAHARADHMDEMDVQAGVWGGARATLHLGRGDLAAAADSLGRAFACARAVHSTAYPFTGLWPVVLAVVDDPGAAAACDDVAALVADTPVSRQMLAAGAAVLLGRKGDAAAAEAAFGTADDALARFEGTFRRDMVRLLVAPCAVADGWGDPVVWLRGALASFDAKGLRGFAEQCRGALRAAGAAVPRGHSGVPGLLAPFGITAREVEVVELLAAGATNREIAGRLHVSVRTVEKHVERVLMKLGVTRAEMARFAPEGGSALRT
jgi:DNA-binding CsgD family transcriptional regulator/tetratricopeptide (TPR) repeat protein